MTDPFAEDTTDAMIVQGMDGSTMHIPDPGPPSPYKQWHGELTPEWLAFIRRGNGPYWLEGKRLVLAQGTDTEDEENLRVEPGEWVTWCGDGYGFELGRVMPVFMRVGWESPELRVGWIQAPEHMPPLLRSMAANWLGTATYERVRDLARQGIMEGTKEGQ